ncbi:MAG TPA: nucleotide exchange factor GrpE [Mycobacteriales bacterium]|nr:nucleotide exchange factor GrpE [Mycobacteriales bacterium]
MSEEFSAAPDGEGEAPVVRDKRRFDPATGERRAEIPDLAAPAASGEPEAPAPGGDDLTAELTADLQRVQAEYANYRRRVERDRQAVGEAALASVMIGLLPVLDDLDRARAHGEVTGGFALVADGLDATLTKLGLSRFGDAGEPFDPTIHEALTHGLSGEVSEPVCSEIYQPGYRVGERVLRPARVAVLEPDTATPAAPDAQPE